MKTLYRAAASLLAVTALSGCAVYADGYGYGNGYPGPYNYGMKSKPQFN